MARELLKWFYMDTWIGDLRFGLRLLWKNPKISALIILILAIAVGANSAVFSVANSLLLNPLPFPNLDRIVSIRESFQGQSQKSIAVSPADFIDWRKQGRSIQSISAYRIRDLTLTAAGDPELLRGSFVSIDFLATLSIHPANGRSFSAQEMEPGADRVVLIGYGFWQRRFGSDPNIVGKEIFLNGRATSIIGIMPQYFDFPFGTEVWAPLALTPEEKTQRDTRNLYVMGLIKPGTSLNEARQEMSIVAEQIERLNPKTNSGLSVQVVPMRDLQADFTKPMLSILMSMAALLLLIACANVANLLLARSATRTKEIAVRAALSASRWRLVRQFMTESLLLSLGAAFLGLIFCFWAIELIRSSLPPDIARFIAGWKEIGIDRHVMLFNFVIAFFTTFLFSLVPALQVSRINLSEALKEGSSFVTSGRAMRRARIVLVASELALALALLSGAALMVKGFWRVLNLYHGNEPERVLTLQTQLPQAKYEEPLKAAQFYQDVLQRMATLRQIKSVAVASNTPLNNSPNPMMEFLMEGRPSVSAGEKRLCDMVVASPGYFRMVGVPMLQGRDLQDRDSGNAPLVAVISKLMASRFWPNQDPIGKKIRRAGSDAASPWITIVGVVSDAKQSWFDRETRPQIYLSYLQFPRLKMTFLLRANADPYHITREAQAQVFAVDPNQPVTEVKTLARLYADEGSPFRFAAVLILVFGLVAFILSAVGVYALMSYSVAQRTREIGIRNALGANKLHILLLIFRQAALIAGIGLVAGSLLALALSRVLESTLFGVVRIEAALLFALGVLFVSIVLFACYLPARRAAMLDPAAVLRSN